MARIRQKAAEYAAKDFATEVRMAGVRMGPEALKPLMRGGKVS